LVQLSIQLGYSRIFHSRIFSRPVCIGVQKIRTYTTDLCVPYDVALITLQRF